ncbi:MAG TPA: hypothetical protein VLT16_10675 [Candidatus Limnocylindrales bacterium]|nr:hypothetical protein [Candidatus Limnocylindrales bacterium]
MTTARQFTLVLCLIFASVMLSAAAAPADDFTATYSLGTPVATAQGVQITISLKVANNTSSDVSNATIALHEPRAARVTYGTLTGLSLPAGARTPVSGSFTVPQDLYESWQKGSSPAMSVSFTDAKGQPVRAFIQF